MNTSWKAIGVLIALACMSQKLLAQDHQYQQDLEYGITVSYNVEGNVQYGHQVSIDGGNCRFIEKLSNQFCQSAENRLVQNRGTSSVWNCKRPYDGGDYYRVILGPFGPHCDEDPQPRLERISTKSVKDIRSSMLQLQDKQDLWFYFDPNLANDPEGYGVRIDKKSCTLKQSHALERIWTCTNLGNLREYDVQLYIKPLTSEHRVVVFKTSEREGIYQRMVFDKTFKH
ncbi:MAG: hypothetical protein KDD52_02950 [Bdellovibrionales bacterium]|nr:hypothetical protein [Bdellovibrionales bacterium]